MRPKTSIAFASNARIRLDTLLRDLTGHDRKPAAFLVYLWLAGEQSRRRTAVDISYQELAENTGLSRSSAQSSVRWLLRRHLLSVRKANPTAVPCYTVLFPWRSRAGSTA
jgi:hypothetical protein